MRTWAELYEVVARTAPLTVFVDPLADRSEDPREHFARFAREWHFPIVVYTELVPQLAVMLLTMVYAGIRTILFARGDDDLDRIVDAVPWDLHEPPRRVA